jgi:hypothetical protein
MGKRAIPQRVLERMENGAKGRDYIESLGEQLIERWKGGKRELAGWDGTRVRGCGLGKGDV